MASVRGRGRHDSSLDLMPHDSRRLDGAFCVSDFPHPPASNTTNSKAVSHRLARSRVIFTDRSLSSSPRRTKDPLHPVRHW